MKKINLNMIDVKYVSSSNFKASNFLITKNGKTDYKYGTKLICIANYILGLAKTNLKKGESHSFKWNNAKINLSNKQSIILYKHIAKKFNCSLEWIRCVVNRLIQLNVLLHTRINNSIFWVYTLINPQLIINFYRSCRKVIKNKIKIINTSNNNSNDPPDDPNLKIEMIEEVEWDE